MPLARRDAVRSSAGRRPDGRPTARGAPPVKERVAHPGLDAAYGDHEARTPTHGYETTRQAATVRLSFRNLMATCELSRQRKLSSRVRTPRLARMARVFFWTQKWMPNKNGENVLLRVNL